jgi:ATP-binding protein involved in chromosome partitioning
VPERDPKREQLRGELAARRAASDGLRSPARFVVAVASGKGGVGKSTVSLNIALALHERGRAVGLLDADLYGPDIPRMLNLARQEELTRWNFWSRERAISLEPVERFGLKVMSVGFLLAERQPFSLPGQWTYFVGRQLVHEVDWGRLDYLIVDLPPGTADLQQELIRLLPLAAAIIVVSPQDVAHLDAKKVVSLFEQARVRILGGVENMAGLSCPHCGEWISVFPTVRQERSLWALGVPLLAHVPLEPAVAQAADAGTPALLARPNAESAAAFRLIANRIADALELNGRSNHSLPSGESESRA